MGLSKKSFLIEYLKDETRNVAIIPLADKKSMTLSRVSSTAGAKYVSDDFTWLVPGDSAPTLTSQRMAGQPSVTCKQ
ncbi:MliC family protein [Edaphobacter modestus]|uniref:MliC family protein n=1 Tax=Edaphobacter modestus TaxID=388466 RepID=UPI00102AEDA3